MQVDRIVAVGHENDVNPDPRAKDDDDVWDDCWGRRELALMVACSDMASLMFPFSSAAVISSQQSDSVITSDDEAVADSSRMRSATSMASLNDKIFLAALPCEPTQELDSILPEGPVFWPFAFAISGATAFTTNIGCMMVSHVDVEIVYLIT